MDDRDRLKIKRTLISLSTYGKRSLQGSRCSISARWSRWTRGRDRSANDLQQFQDRYTRPYVATVDVWISEEQSRSPGHTLTGRRDEERHG
jgi:hypothetical protein